MSNLERRAAALLELSLLAALTILLIVAGWKLFGLLERFEVGWWRRAPMGLLFGIAIYLAGKRTAKKFQELR